VPEELEAEMPSFLRHDAEHRHGAEEVGAGAAGAAPDAGQASPSSEDDRSPPEP